MAASNARLVAFRMDDVGACSKRYEVYSDWSCGIGPLRISGNWLFLKYLPPLKKWGPYREMTAKEWYQIFQLLQRAQATLTVAVTAAWVESDTAIIPFPEQFPEEAAALREGVRDGLIEIANHGLTHCVVEGQTFKPRWWSSNRQFHREFWAWVPDEIQEDHLRRSQEILQEAFQTEVVTFVPPGNVFTPSTLEIARRYGLRYVSCRASGQNSGPMIMIDDEGVQAFHDRDIVLRGVSWLQHQLKGAAGATVCTVRQLAEQAAQQVPV